MEAAKPKIPTADPANPIRFEENSVFFMCRNCGTHILSIENYLDEDDMLEAVICRNPVNVHTIVADVDLVSEPLLVVVCNQCNFSLGQKINFQFMNASPMPLEGGFLFPTKKMLYRDGRLVVYADSGQLVSNI